MKNFFLAISSIFAALPGIGSMIYAIGVPESKSKILFGAIVQVFGCLSLVYLWFNRNNIFSYPHNKVNKVFIIFFISSLILVFIYLFLFKSNTFEFDNETIIKPLYYNSEIINEINSNGSFEKFVDELGFDKVNNKLQEKENLSITITYIIFLLIYLTIFVLLTLCFGILGIRITRTDQKEI